MQKKTLKVTKDNLKIGERVYVIDPVFSKDNGPLLTTMDPAVVVSLPPRTTGSDTAFVRVIFYYNGLFYKAVIVNYSNLRRALDTPEYAIQYQEMKTVDDNRSSYCLECSLLDKRPAFLANDFSGKTLTGNTFSFSSKEYCKDFALQLAAKYNAEIRGFPQE